MSNSLCNMRHFTMGSILFLYLFLCLHCANGLKILAISPVVAHSHYLIGNAVAKEMATRGHDVTFVSPFQEKEPVDNLRTIVLTGFVETWNEMQRNENIFQVLKMPVFLVIPFMGSMGHTLVDKTLGHEEIQKLLKSDEKFDVVILEQFMSDGLQVIAHHYKAPVVLLSAVAPCIWTNHLVGNPDIPSYMTSIFLEPPVHKDFFKRTYNTLLYIIHKIYDHLYLFPTHNEIVQRHYPGAPHIYELIYNTSLILLNSDVAYSSPIPTVPNMIEIGGIHIKPPKQLPDDLRNILDNSKDGVIYFSMGSVLRGKDLPPAKKEAILKALSKLKQTVLWKYEEDLHEKPRNVIIQKWFPQSDLLAHPNIRLFITHGGLLSTIESLHRGVPILGIPVYGDQKLNMATAVNKGYGVMVHFEDISEDTLTKAFDEVLNNPIYRENTKYGSKLLQDHRENPGDRAEFWIDYVVRHKGAKHLRPAALEMPWYQHVSLDVILFLTAVTIVLFIIFYIIIRWLLGRRRRPKQKTN